MNEQLTMCDSCGHYQYGNCYVKTCYHQTCVYEPKLSCTGCVDDTKKTYKGTKCLDCKRWKPLLPCTIVKDIQDKYREK